MDNKNNDKQCLVCKDRRIGGGRGLCEKHYRQFKAELDALPENEAAVYESRAIEKGFVLPKKKGGRPRSPSPFPALAAEVRAQYAAKPSIDEETQRLDEELTQQENAAKREIDAKRPAKRTVKRKKHG